MIADDVSRSSVALLFGGRRLPRPLAGLAGQPVHAPEDIDTAAARYRRLIVVGSDAELAAVLTRLLRADRSDVEVGHASGWWAARRARRGVARRVPLIRDETGQVIVGAAEWRGESGGHWSARRSSTTPGCSTARWPASGSNPLPGLPGCGRPSADAAAAVGGRAGRPTRHDGCGGGARGRRSAKMVRRSTFYRHTQGWLLVR